MRNLIAPAAIAFSLVIGSAAFAATPAATTPAKPAMATTKTSTAAKKAECEKSWNSQKTHSGDKASFIKACVAKG